MKALEFKAAIPRWLFNSSVPFYCFNDYRRLDQGTPDGEGKEHADLLDRQPANPASAVERFGNRDP